MAPSPRNHPRNIPQFLQWNCKSITSKRHELNFLLQKNSVAIAAISETWLKPNSRFRVQGFACLRDDRVDGYAGSALLIGESLTYSQISLPSHSDAFNVVAAKVLDISFVSIYIPHPSPSLIPDLQSVLSCVPQPLIVLGDFNTHHTSWGSPSCDSFSTHLLDVFDEYNLCVLK